MKRILLITNDVAGKRMAGPAIRAVEIARALRDHRDLQVTLAAPEPSRKVAGLPTFIYRHARPRTLLPALERAEVVIAQSLHPSILAALRRRQIKFVADLYDPVVLENLEAQRTLTLTDQTAQHAFFHALTALQVAAADHIICASERQRDYWLGLATALGRLTPTLYRSDPTLTDFISLLPFGYAAQRPKLTDPAALSRLVPSFNPKRDHLFVWGGGIWNWFDPLSLLRAVAATRRADIKLLFLGTKHPNPLTPEMKMLTAAHQLATKLHLLDRRVFFNTNWVPYAELANYLLPATAGVSTHFDHAETRLSFRTRIISYIWAGLPIIATRGDALADLVEKEKIGLTVNYHDFKGLSAALTALTDRAVREPMRQRLTALWPRYTWPALVKPLADRLASKRLAKQDAAIAPLGRFARRYYWTGINKVWRSRGLTGLLSKLIR